MQLTSSGNLSAASFEEGINLLNPAIVDHGTIPVPNLVTNGLGEQGTNYNFPGTTYHTDDYLIAPGCFYAKGALSPQSTEIIEINKDENYKLKGSFKSIGIGGECKIYFGISNFDVDGNAIGHWHVHYYESTKTILTADLNNGDSVAYIRDTSTWKTSAAATYQRYVGMWGSMSDYPDYTYTRNIPRYDSNDTVNNTVTLYQQWNGATVPSGTPVANMYAGGTYQYIAAPGVFVPSGSWTEYTNSDVGITSWDNYAQETGQNYFRYGTKYIKTLMLLNYQQDTTYEILFDKILWYNISRSQSLPVAFNINSNDNVNCNEFVEGYTDGATLRMREEKYADMEDVDNYRIKIKGELIEKRPPPPAPKIPTEFTVHNMTDYDLPVPFVVTDSSHYTNHYGWRLWMGLWANVQIWETDHLELTGWVTIDIGSGNEKIMTNYKVRQTGFYLYFNRMAKDWTMEGSNNGTDWTTIDTVTGETNWIREELRSFTCDTQTTAYRYFKFNVSANNGNTSYLHVGELYYYGTT